MRTVALMILLLHIVTGELAAQGQLQVRKAAGTLGVWPYIPDKWGVLAVEVVNPTNRDADVLVSTSMQDNPGRRFGRLFWVPAGAKLHSWYPLLPSKPKSPNSKIESIVADRTDTPQKLLKDPSGRMRHWNVLPITTNRSVTAVIVDPAALSEEETALNAVRVFRFRQTASRRLVAFTEFLPSTAQALDALSHLVLYNDRIASDSAALIAVRRWVQGGGRLWIMLDRVQPETVERLLGNVKPYHELDRASLTEVRLQAKDQSRWNPDLEERQFEPPVEMTRVLISGVELAHSVNNWPASFWQNYGRGKILYTTLEMSAWLQTPSSEQRNARFGGSAYAPTKPLESLGLEYYTNTGPSQLQPALFDDYLTEQIGYAIVPRSVVVLVLGLFCSALLVAGAWLAMHRRLDQRRSQEQIALGVETADLRQSRKPSFRFNSRCVFWFAPATSVVAAAILIVIGFSSRQAVPDTVALVQLVDVESDAEDVSLTGRMAIYRRAEATEIIGAKRGGLLEPGLAQRSGTTRRMVWTDLDQWHWEDATLPAGLHSAAYSYAANIKRPVRASAWFGPKGLTGTLDTGPFQEPADAIVSTPSQFNLVVPLSKDGSFVAGSEEMITRTEFVAGRLLSGEQRRRQEVYRKLLLADERGTFADRTTLFVWTRPIEMGFRLAADTTRQTGSALLAIPLRLDRTAPGSRVQIPAAFLPYQGVADPDGNIFASAFNNLKKDWVEQMRSAETWLRIQLPKQVLPIRIERVTATVHFDGAPHKFDLIGAVDGRPVTLANLPKPVAKTSVHLERPEAFGLDDDGGIKLGLVVHIDDDDQTRWRIDSVRFEVEGQSLKPNNQP